MNKQSDNFSNENIEMMQEEINGQADNPQQELATIQELLIQLPDELLMNALSEKRRHSQDSQINPQLIKVVQEVSQQFSGPIPPPHILSGYDKVQTGFAERIIAMAEKEQVHRHGIEHQALSAGISVQKRGQIYALIVSLVILSGSMFLIHSGMELSGSALAGSSLIGLAYIFITGRKTNESADKK